MADIVAVDDELVEKLLQLLSDVDTSDDSRTENLSLKSVAGMLYRHQQDVDSDAVDCHDVHDDEQQMFPSPAVIISSTADFCRESQISVSEQLPFTSTTSADARHNASSDLSCIANSVPCNSDTYLDRRSQNVECLWNSFLSTSSSETPYFCIPTVPVISPSITCAQRGQRPDERVCNAVGQNRYCDVSERTTTTDDSSTVSLSDELSTVSLTSTPSTLTCSWTSLPSTWPSSYSRTPLLSASILSSSQPVLSNDHIRRSPQSVYSQASNKTVMSTSEALNRMCELLTAQCKVLVLMRGCPGSGKSTMAMYVPLSVNC